MSDPEAPPPVPAGLEPSLDGPPAAPLELAPQEPSPAPAPISSPDRVLEAVQARQRDKWIGMGIVGVTFLLGIGISFWAKHASRPETSAPPGPPTTLGIRGFPYKVDVTATLVGARAVTKRNLLRGFTAEGVRPDGTIDLTEGPGRASYVFQSAPGEGPQPDSEIGPLPRRPLCGRQEVHLRHEGLVADPDQPNLPCVPKGPDPLPDPQCSLATIWQHALERGLRSDRLARIEYYRSHGGPAYRFEQQETGARFVLYGDCRRELRGRSPLVAFREARDDQRRPRRAGVSTATVSFVLNQNPKEAISEIVRARVLESARALSYHPSAAAAALARRRVQNVALVFYKDDDTITNPFYSFVVQGAIKEAIERNYDLLFSYVDSTYTGYESLPKIVREKNAGGVLFMRRIEPRMVEDIQALGIPVVAVDEMPRILGLNSVQIDNRRGGLIAASHLLELGHERLAMVVPKRPPRRIEERLEGFRAAFDKFERPFSRSLQIAQAETLTFRDGYDTTRRLIEKQRLTALFCANDEMAAGALRAAREMGLQVPRDFSVIGFDDIVMSNYTDPPLTTIKVVREHMGRRAMTRLIELVEHTDRRVKVEIAPVELVLRESTGKPPDRERGSPPKPRV